MWLWIRAAVYQADWKYYNNFLPVTGLPMGPLSSGSMTPKGQGGPSAGQQFEVISKFSYSITMHKTTTRNTHNNIEQPVC